MYQVRNAAPNITIPWTHPVSTELSRTEPNALLAFHCAILSLQDRTVRTLTHSPTNSLFFFFYGLCRTLEPCWGEPQALGACLRSSFPGGPERGHYDWNWAQTYQQTHSLTLSLSLSLFFFCGRKEGPTPPGALTWASLGQESQAFTRTRIP